MNMRSDDSVLLEQEFSDASLEWRRIFAEFWGTFLLVFAVACGDVASALDPAETTRLSAAVASGLMVLVAIYFLGSVSGAHLNPAVTYAFALRGNFPWRRTLGYVLAQLGGAVAAALLLKLLFGPVAGLGATTPQRGVTFWQAFAVEAVLTVGLVNAILGTASGARNIGANAGIAIGCYNIAARLCAVGLTGASMNPARSPGPDLVRGDFSASLIYVAAPLVGATIGVGFEWILKGPSKKSGDIAAQGEDDVRRSD
jgi:aquaporin Z